ncbi:GntR family transcriptional regulator [Streptomyces sp. CB02959]|uniref:GntR family transcriptional regulator n=1 Tax=Streptomyces sp. CB02959 TaxID=2020330 RepID=UPI000C2774EC|nr:winged helix-turn-helix domain-containing protein [Streptomyces sp. CB02959]PJN37942.1 GntR family transcriptional regulator [Streptomyces sp. CB02959]
MPGASARGTYLRIADDLRQDIREGRITKRLSSEAQLMRDHGVSRTTIRRALMTLQDEGLIHSEPGAGWAVSGADDRRPLTERLIEIITATPLAIGDAFPSEASLCESFGLSRTAVRSALAQLEGQGLLEAVHGKGRTVRALPSSTTTT